MRPRQGRSLAAAPAEVDACPSMGSALSVIASPCRPGIAREDGGSSSPIQRLEEHEHEHCRPSRQRHA